jgi:hypothetical protein
MWPLLRDRSLASLRRLMSGEQEPEGTGAAKDPSQCRWMCAYACVSSHLGVIRFDVREELSCICT